MKCRWLHLGVCALAMVTATQPLWAAEPAAPYVILNVDGEKISSKEAEDAWKSLFPDGAAPQFDGFDEDVRQNVLRGLVSERLLYKEAQKAGIMDREAVQRRLRNLEKQIAIQAYIEELSDSFISETALKEAYNEYVASTQNQDEVRAAHILVETEEKADEVVTKLEKGGDFKKLATTLSKDKASATRGGDLNYFTKDKMVTEFSEAAFDLKPGEISKPVKTDFGWHVIKVLDRRHVQAKSFEEMQEQLKADIRKKGVEHYVNQLIDKADVKYYSASGKRKKLNLKQ